MRGSEQDQEMIRSTEWFESYQEKIRISRQQLRVRNTSRTMKRYTAPSSSELFTAPSSSELFTAPSSSESEVNTSRTMKRYGHKKHIHRTKQLRVRKTA